MRITDVKARKQSEDEVAVDLEESVMFERFVDPWREGKPILINGPTAEASNVPRAAGRRTNRSGESGGGEQRCSDQNSEKGRSRHHAAGMYSCCRLSSSPDAPLTGRKTRQLQ